MLLKRPKLLAIKYDFEFDSKFNMWLNKPTTVLIYLSTTFDYLSNPLH